MQPTLDRLREQDANRIAELETAILKAHGRALPANWVYTDPQTTLDLLVAECAALRAENESLKTENAPLYSDRVANLEAERDRYDKALMQIAERLGCLAAEPEVLHAVVNTRILTLEAERDAARNQAQAEGWRADAMQTENDTLQGSIKELHEAVILKTGIEYPANELAHAVAARIAELQKLREANAENAVLRKIIEDAPHADDCLLGAQGYGSCDCWKNKIPKAKR